MRARFALPALLAATIVSAVAFASCADPVHDQQVQALGPEAKDVPQGEFHRAGQPCTVCHGDEGPANQPFSVAGTVFFDPDTATGAENVQVEMVDSLGTKHVATTNCVGNFFVTPDEWNPAFPILVQIQYGTNIVKMVSQISRDGSCATCHKDPPNYDAKGHVTVYATAQSPDKEPIDDTCPVDPHLFNAGGPAPPAQQPPTGDGGAR